MSSSKGYEITREEKTLTYFDAYIGNKVKILVLEDFLQQMSLFGNIYFKIFL
ncbi:protein of unknown function [Bartonella clarridgeiae 73]|uniref:Uncharacterized protein n=1 Tax=Bartonella clarridgeiae (strain CCUG 45776 / CIP 104772 / 73) TaxID=696125 RepID=E6YG48_BARC7|nr:MAG: hypothetical protein PG977_000949 [Bartonella clarridgeiae]CBI75836.1 protein of unknown function [Bartonella clarridgeiae 73]